MLYLLLSVAHYKQLAVVDQALLDDLARAVLEIEKSYGYGRSHSRDGDTLFCLGEERTLDPRQALEFAFALRAALGRREEELFGYELLLALAAAGERPEAVVRRLHKALLEAEDTGQLRAEQELQGMLSGLVEGRREGGFFRITGGEVGPVQAQRRPGGRVRDTALAREVARKVRLMARGPGGRAGLLLHGPVSTERSLVVDAAERRVFHASAIPRAPRMYPLFRRRSILHPLLNAIDPFFFHEVSQYLSRVEQGIWARQAPLLLALKPSLVAAEGLRECWPRGVPGSARPSRGSAAAPPSGPAEALRPGAAAPGAGSESGGAAAPGGIAPDRLSRDFLLGFQLYLSAYLRMLEENFLPGLLICEDVDTWHPRSLEALAVLARDFSHLPSFVLLATCSKAEAPKELGDLRLESVAVKPLGISDLARVATRMYRGAAVPRPALSRLRAYTRGRLLVFCHCLRFLEGSGFLTKEDGSFRWEEPQSLEQALPARAATVSWRAASALPPSLRRLLYLVYLQSGLLDLWGMLDLLKGEGLAPPESLRQLRELEGRGLVRLTNHALPVFPAFRRRLRKAALKREPDIETRFGAYLIERWRRGSYPHRVLLYLLLTRVGHPGEAAEVLEELLAQKLDELDFQGVSIFLDPKHFRPEAAKPLPLLLAAVRLRHMMLQGRMREAEEAYLSSMELGSDFQVNPQKGGLFLQIARYFHGRGDTPMAMQWVKKSVLQFQGASQARGEREASVELGMILLADGKFEEALEYFTIAEQLAVPAAGLTRVVTHALKAVALFVQGNLSRAADETRKGAAVAEQTKSREWGLFLEFLEARIRFELGFYAEARDGLQSALATEAVYELPAARSVLYRWLGRAHAYTGSYAAARRLLGEGEDSWERLYFLSECHFFQQEYGPALAACGRAVSMEQASPRCPVERVSWADGFRDVEGRCLELLRENTMQLRLLQAFQGYLWGLEGSSERAVEQLHSLTRGGRLPASDPYQSLYHYFYACVLPEVRKDDLDDSLTVLSKALKLLQQRASKTEDSSLRWRYLSSNYWNGLLFAEARKKKMI